MPPTNGRRDHPPRSIGRNALNAQEKIAQVEKLFEEKKIQAGEKFEDLCRVNEEDVRIKPKKGRIFPNDYTDTFDALGLPEQVMDNMRRLGFKKMTPIQRAAFPIVMSERNVMASAPTGTGKTAAFLLPIIKHIHDSLEEYGDDHDDGELCAKPYAIIVTSSHEQAELIGNEARMLTHRSNIVCGVIYGGVPMKKELGKLEPKTHILVCCIGRMLHFINESIIKLDALEVLVLDQVDLLMNINGKELKKIAKSEDELEDAEAERTIQRFMGLQVGDGDEAYEQRDSEGTRTHQEPPNKKKQRTAVELEHMVKYLKEDVQMLMFTATHETLALRIRSSTNFTKSYANTTSIMIKSEHFAANEDIDQVVVRAPLDRKLDILLELLIREMSTTKDNLKNGILEDGAMDKRWLIFVKSTERAVALQKHIGFAVIFHSGSKSAKSVDNQRARNQSMMMFKSGEAPVMFATMLAARGLEISGLDHVIQYDLPDPSQTDRVQTGLGKKLARAKAQFQAEYVNRMGRTGRIGNRGVATCFYDPEGDSRVAPWLIEVMARTYQTIPDWLLAEARLLERRRNEYRSIEQ